MENRLKLKIESDGTAEGTRVYDEEGRFLENVVDFKFSVGVNEIPMVTLTLVGVPVEINYVATITSMDELESKEYPTTTIVFPNSKRDPSCESTMQQLGFLPPTE